MTSTASSGETRYPGRPQRWVLPGWAVVAAYGAVVGVLLIRHDMWRDEAQLWLISKASTSPIDLISRTSHEIRPLAWFLICWLISRVTSNIEVLKVINWLFSIAMAATVVYLIPIRRTFQILFLCGFLVLVGYSSISEDYMLGTLLFALCVAAVVNKWSFPVTCLLLAALGNVHFLFLLVALSGLGTITLARIWDRVTRAAKWTWAELSSCVAAWVLCAFSLILIWPSSDNRWKPRAGLDSKPLLKGLDSIATALFPWVDRTPHTFAAVNYGFFVFGAAIAIVVTIIASAWRRSVLLGLHATVSTFLIVVYFAFGNYFFWWHVGILCLNLIWILVLTMTVTPPDTARAKRSTALTRVVLAVVLLAQVYAVFTPPGRHLLGRHPYSSAKNTAAYIESVCNNRCTVVASHELNFVAISAYLERPLYYVDRGRLGTYAPWEDLAYVPSEWPDIVAAARRFPRAIIVTDSAKNPPAEVKLVASFTGAVWADENFHVWRLVDP